MFQTTNDSFDEPWPILTKEAFATTSHLLHMGVQMVGKMMLLQPFNPHWSNLAMPLTSRGITTGVIPYGTGTFSADFDFIDHLLIFSSSWGEESRVCLNSMSVAELASKIFQALESMGIELDLLLLPQEVSKPISFDKDTSSRIYDKDIIHRWWRILLSTYRVLLKFHSKFYGITPQIGLFFGTLDLRDARYKGQHLPIPKEMSHYIARNAMDDAQFEVGWSASNEKYPTPSFFAFSFPKPEGLENATIHPSTAKWVTTIGEHILDYEDFRCSKDPEKELLDFFESCYHAVAKLGNWDRSLNVSGKPV